MIERKIIIGLITSTEYLQQIKPSWNIKLLESAVAKRIAMWCWEYYDAYNKAPGRDLESIYYEHLKSGKLPKDIAEEIEQDILPDLNEEFLQGEELNIPYLVTITKKHFKERALILHSEEIKALVDNDQIEEAEKLITTYTPISKTNTDLNDFIVSAAQIRRNKKPVPKTLMKYWLKEGQTTIIYGNYGSGKSLLTILIAYVLGTKNYEDIKIGEWEVDTPTGCLYIDGELGEQEMEERISQFEWLGSQHRDFRMKVLSVPEYQLATEDTFYLSTRENQLKITTWLKNHPTYKLVVLDSASTLFGLVEENDNSEWNTKINPFLRDLRAMGVACLMLHHAGKDNKKGLRGASAMGAMAHNIFRLTNHGDKDPDAGEAWFILTKDKQRASGHIFKTFAMHFSQDDDKKSTQYEITKINFD